MTRDEKDNCGARPLEVKRKRGSNWGHWLYSKDPMLARKGKRSGNTASPTAFFSKGPGRDAAPPGHGEADRGKEG